MQYLALALIAATMSGAAAANLSRAQAAAFEKKVQAIVQQGEARGARGLQTVVTESELNSYLRFSAGEQLPVGVTDPAVAIEGEGRLHGRAIVDLDQIRQKKSSGGWFDPTSYLTGRLPVTATGTLHTHQGRGRFTLETATVGGVPVPKMFLQEIVTFYTRTADTPRGINIDDPFELPAEIQRIEVHKGRATIVQ